MLATRKVYVMNHNARKKVELQLVLWARQCASMFFNVIFARGHCSFV